jgi:hypothetical protein
LSRASPHLSSFRLDIPISIRLTIVTAAVIHDIAIRIARRWVTENSDGCYRQERWRYTSRREEEEEIGVGKVVGGQRG